MLKKLALLACLLALICGCLGCGKEKKELIGVAMPNRTSQRWIWDGNNMKEKLEKAGFAVELAYAGDDESLQKEQIRRMLEAGARCLVISAVNPEGLSDVLEDAKKKKVPVISYDRLLMNTDAISYYATFDSHASGKIIGEYVVRHLELDKGKGPFTVEFFAGAANDNNAHLLYDGAIEMLKPYMQTGQLVTRSRQTSFEDVSIENWSKDFARNRMEELAMKYYADTKLDVVVSPSDTISDGIIRGLESSGYLDKHKVYPLITGQDATIPAAKDIIAGKQTMTVFKDTRVLADRCVAMVEAIAKKEKLEVDNNTSYNNHKITVPTALCTPVLVDRDTIGKELIESGYYKQSDFDNNTGGK